MIDKSKILSENKKRNADLFAHYDPFLGIGSPVQRHKFVFDSKFTFYLMDEAFQDPIIKEISKYKSVEDYIKTKLPHLNITVAISEMFNHLDKVRRNHDFEYWAYVYHPIQDAETGEVSMFKFRRPQRNVWKEILVSIRAKKPIRAIIGKARQWGGSTFANALHRWIQIEIKRNWDSAICADVEDQAKNIRGMSDLMYERYPHTKLNLSPYQGSSKNKIVKERGCIVGVGSMEKPDNLRSFNFKMLHLTEVGLWKKTQNRSPKALAQSLRSQVKKVEWSVIILESTAKGTGNFFHDEWLKAVKSYKEGKAGYIPIFVPWFEIEIYQKPIDDYERFIDTMNEYAWYLWELGATLEGINWYFDFKDSENMDDIQMNSEYPSTPEEMFATTGRRAFSPLYVKRARLNNMPPMFIGDIFGDAFSGKEALNNIRFEAYSKGQLKIWAFPDTSVKCKNRYVVTVDIGGKSKGADYSVIRVLDRYPLLFGGVPDAILTWKGHLDQDYVIWKATQIAKIYDNALLVPEQNSLRKDIQASEGDHFLTLLDEIIEYYDNIFCRTTPEQIKQGAPKRYGFHTGSNKADLVTNTNKKLRDDGYVEYDSEVCDEYDWYEIKDDGTFGAIEGQHDDLVMATAIGNKASDLMEMPVIIKESNNSGYSKQIVSEATF